jgi:hypothetical protein
MASKGCKHDQGTFLSSLTSSLWGPSFGRFCKLCGACTTRKGVPSRPDEAAQLRSLNHALEGPLTPIDDEKLRRAVERDMEKWIGPNGPFREGLTWRG